jgi:hypothetical protein
MAQMYVNANGLGSWCSEICEASKIVAEENMPVTTRRQKNLLKLSHDIASAINPRATMVSVSQMIRVADIVDVPSMLCMLSTGDASASLLSDRTVCEANSHTKWMPAMTGSESAAMKSVVRLSLLLTTTSNIQGMVIERSAKSQCPIVPGLYK